MKHENVIPMGMPLSNLSPPKTSTKQEGYVCLTTGIRTRIDWNENWNGHIPQYVCFMFGIGIEMNDSHCHYLAHLKIGIEINKEWQRVGCP